MSPDETPPLASSEHIDTQLATQILDDPRSAVLRAVNIGKDVGDHTRELFVVCLPAEALRQQFEHLTVPFMAMHDIAGTGRVLPTLQALSARSGWPLQKLVIRRQGFGNVLATLHYLEAPATNHRALRLYATDIEADEANRSSVSQLLISQAALTAVLVPGLSDADMPRAFEGLECLIADGSSPEPHHRQLAFVPMHKRTPALNSAVDALRLNTGLRSEVLPATAEPSLVWPLLATSWNRITGALHAMHPDGPLTLMQVRLGQPEAALATPPPEPQTPASYLSQAIASTQAHAACLFDIRTMAMEAHHGTLEAEALAKHGRALLMALSQGSQAWGLGGLINECWATMGSAQMVLRAVPGHKHLAMVLLMPLAADLSARQAALRQLDNSMG